TNGFRPEFGRLGGGLINVASRAGANDWRGSAFYFYRGDALNSDTFELNALGRPHGHLVGNQPGFAVGGPIIHDKLFFFNSTEGIIVRSRVDRVGLVPTPQLLGLSSVNSSTFVNAFPLTTPLPTTTPGNSFTFAQAVNQLGGPAAFAPGSPFLALATNPATANL